MGAIADDGGQAAGDLPAVVRHGAPGFPKTAKVWPANRGNLFAGGAGGTKRSAAELTVQFTGAGGRILATVAIGPAGATVADISLTLL